MNETSGPKRPFLGEHEDRWRRLEKEEEVGWSEEKGGVGWFVTFNLHWSPMALEKKGGEGDITHTHRQTHKHTGNDAGNCCTWMSTHTHTQGRCQRTYGSCLCTQCEEPNRKWKDYLAVDCNTTDQRWHSCTLRSARQPLLPASLSQIQCFCLSFDKCTDTRWGSQTLNNDLCDFLYPFFISRKRVEWTRCHCMFSYIFDVCSLYICYYSVCV